MSGDTKFRYNVESKMRSSGIPDIYQYPSKETKKKKFNRKKAIFVQVCICCVLLAGIMITRNTEFSFSEKLSAVVDKVLTQQTDFNELSKNNIIQSVGQALEKGYKLAISDVFSSSSNTFITPVEGSITSKFENRTHPVFNTTIEARGIEITTENGSEVKSIADGQVKIVATSTIQKQRVVIEYDDGYLGIFDGIVSSVKEDEQVSQGQKIGEAYADSEEKALVTFELWRDSKALNPEDYIEFDEE
jgi:murein DD-endopeptidase MepM/ murein hydrolase activator NlpD